jgi:hypothetical protein
MAELYDVTVDPLRFLWGSTVWMMTLQVAPVIPFLLMRKLIAVNRFWMMVACMWWGRLYSPRYVIGPLFI